MKRNLRPYADPTPDIAIRRIEHPNWDQSRDGYWLTGPKGYHVQLDRPTFNAFIDQLEMRMVGSNSRNGRFRGRLKRKEANR